MLQDTPLLVGLDLGTTTIKAVIFTPIGQTVAQASSPTPTCYPRPGWAYHEPEAFWQATVKAIRSAVQQLPSPNPIVSLAVASMGEAGVPLDSHQQPVYDMIAWFDQRTEPQVNWLTRHVGQETLFAIAGVALQPIFSLCKLLWLKENEPDVFKRVAHWLNLADYIAYRLCGQMATDYSIASRMLTMNLHTRQWADSLLNQVGIPSTWLPPLRPSGDYLATVQPDAAMVTGLPSHVKISVGGHDQLTGALAAGVVAANQVMDSLGTSEAICTPIERILTDPIMGKQGYTQGAHVVAGLNYIIGGLYTSGASVAWLHEVAGVDYETILAEAAQVPATSLGTVFLPHFNFANSPNNDPKARGSFIGLSNDSDRGVLMRAVLEGIAYEARSSLEPMLAYAGCTAPPKISLIGGGSRNQLLMQIKASIYNRPLTVLEVSEGTALGAAMLGGLGANLYESIDMALQTIDLPENVINPIPAQAERYERYFRQVYQPLYATLQPLNHAIHHLDNSENEV